jgi:hypothetical protein
MAIREYFGGGLPRPLASLSAGPGKVQRDPRMKFLVPIEFRASQLDRRSLSVTRSAIPGLLCRQAAFPQPIGVERTFARLVDPPISMGPEVVPLGLDEIGGQPGRAVTIVVG